MAIACIGSTLLPAALAIDPQWTQRWGGVEGDSLYAMTVDKEGGGYAAGYWRGAFQPPASDGIDMVVLRFDAAGNVLWKSPATSEGQLRIHAMANFAGSLFVAGSTVGLNQGNGSIGLAGPAAARYGATGQLMWSRQFGVGLSEAEWRLGQDGARAIAVDGSGAFIAGETRWNLTTGAPKGDFDIFLAHFDPEGNLTWLRQFDELGNQTPSSVAVSRDGVVVVGHGSPPEWPMERYSFYDALVYFIERDGTLRWKQSIGDENHEQASGVWLDGESVYVAGNSLNEILAGSHNSTENRSGFVVRFASNGSRTWTYQFDSVDTLHVIGIDGDATGVTVGALALQSLECGASSSGRDHFVARRLSPQGVELWSLGFQPGPPVTGLSGPLLWPSDVAFGMDSTSLYFGASASLNKSVHTESGPEDWFVAKTPATGVVPSTCQRGGFWPTIDMGPIVVALALVVAITLARGARRR